MKTRLTQQDIARLASVSQATVSRVLAGDDSVDEKTRERVQDLVKEHNYMPDVRGRSLRNSRTGLIGLVVKRPEGGLADDPFFANLIARIVEYLSSTPYHLCLDVVISESGQQAIYDEMLRTRRVDGLILVEPKGDDERIQRLQSDKFPFVLIGNPRADNLWSVDNDNVLAAEIATKHLIEQGFKKIGILGGPKGLVVSDDRIEGYCKAIRGHQTSRVWQSDFGYEAARQAAFEILTGKDVPDALVVLDDFMAMGVVLAARALNVRIPQDLGLISFNDSSLCGLLDGGLSSVSLNIEDIVRLACTNLLEIIEDRSTAPRREIVNCELQVRGSSRRCLEALR